MGGFITTFLSWRVGFLLEIVVIGVVLAGIRMVKDVPFTGERGIDLVGAVLSVLGMGGIVLGILVWEEGGGAVGVLIAGGAISLGLLAWWLVRRKRAGQLALLDPDLFRAAIFRLGISGQMLQQIALGGAMIALPIFLQMVLEYNTLPTDMAESSVVLSPAEAQQVATALDEDAQPMSDTQLAENLVGQPPDVQAEIIRINTEARPIALQVALLVPLLAGLLGLAVSLGVRRQKDVAPTTELEGLVLG